ncbi:MAG: hypothetical protein ACI4YB_04120 [Oscillospiraceae bacterium]
MKNERKIILWFLGICLVLAMYSSSLLYIEQMAHIYPKTEWKSLENIVKKTPGTLTESELELVFEQTGLGRAAVMKLTDLEKLDFYQDNYYSEVEYERFANSPFSSEEYVEAPTATLDFIEKGDILITHSSRVFSWRNGHAAIVIDADEGKTLEAVVIGQDTCIQDIEKWRHYPNFLVLRLKDADEQLRSDIADTALELLCDKPYRLLTGVFSKKYPDRENIAGTQCAHLVWLACAYHGFDIDSDGGLIVTPKDISESDLLEVVQSYGRS